MTQRPIQGLSPSAFLLALRRNYLDLQAVGALSAKEAERALERIEALLAREPISPSSLKELV